MKHHKTTLATENKIRLTAFLVLILSVAFIFTNSVFVPIFLAFDFFLRAFGFGKYSLLAKTSTFISKILKLKEKPVFFPPKQFATKIGLAFSTTLIILNHLEINPLFISSTLAICAGLEALFNFCAGCYVYNLFHSIKHRI